MKTLTHYHRSHTKRRLQERYNLSINRKTRKEIIRKIQNGDAECVRIDSNARKVFDVEVKGVTVRVMYNKRKKELLTALPREEKNEKVS